MIIQQITTKLSDSSPFVGRATELEALRDLLPGRNGGSGRFVSVVGEAGMGKTRLISEFAELAGSKGHEVLWGQMIEDPVAPPNFLWMLAIRSFVRRIDDNTLLRDLGSGATDVAAVVPELHDRLSLEPVKPSRDSATARYQLYDSVTRFLLASAERRPLVLLFDNLQSADRSSIAMLEYFCQQLAASPILVVGAYREHDIDRRHPLRPALHRINRSTGFMRLTLPGLARNEVAELLHSKLQYVPPASLVGTVLEQSGGNPLFVAEVGAMLLRRDPQAPTSGAGVHFTVPQSLRDVIGTRLDALPEKTTTLLRAAAVLGREFETSVLAELVSISRGKVADRMLSAESAGIVEVFGKGRYRFHHILFREVLYAEHNTVSRVMLHRRAGEQLERRYSSNVSPHLSELAHHFFEAAQVGGEDKAILYCQRAAESAVMQRAYGEAAALLDCALQASQIEQSPDYSRRLDLLLALGRAQYQSGELNAAIRTLIKAAILAHQNRWWEQLAEALYLFQLICQQSGFAHVASVPLHKEVLENLGRDNVQLRARVLTSLAKAYRTAGERQLAADAFREGVAIARDSGEPSVLLDCLRKGNWTVGRDPKTIREGLGVAREALTLAAQRQDTAAELDSVVDVIFQLCDLGEIDEVERQLTALSRLSHIERQPHFRNVQVGFEASVAILRGDWNSALRKAQEGVRQFPLQGVRGLRGRFAFQMFAIQKMRGALAELKDLADRIIESSDEATLWLPGQILLYCELGELEKARELIGEVGDPGTLPDDDLLEIALIYLAEASIRLNDRERCRRMYQLLTPYRGLNVALPGTFMLGAVSGYLAMLAAASRRYAEAREFFEEALELNESMQAAPALAQTRAEYARLLYRSENPQERKRAIQLIADARSAAESLGLVPVLETIAGLEADTGVENLTGREIDVLKIIARGSSNKGVAEALNISHSTVTTHMRNIFRKISVANRTEAADYARRTGLLKTD